MSSATAVTRSDLTFTETELTEIERQNEEVLSSLPQSDLGPEDPEYLKNLREDTWWYEPRSGEAVNDEIAGLQVRIFDPGSPQGVYVRIHGGGWVYGSYDAEDEYSWRLARTSKVAVVSVDYRLAPENPWPAPNEDCEAVARGILDQARERFGTEVTFVGGESSGAHLALVTALRLHEAGVELAGVNLVGGIYDLRGVPSIRQFKGPDPLGLSEEVVDWYACCYVGEAPDRRHPDISPLWADLSGMPPLLISTGERDPLTDNSHFLADRVELAGGEAWFDRYQAAMHGFEILNPVHADRYHARVAEWTSFCLGRAAEAATTKDHVGT